MVYEIDLIMNDNWLGCW